MPTAELAPAAIALDAGTIAAIAEAVAARTVLPLLVPQARAWNFLGLSRSAFYRLKGTAGFPREVSVPGAGPCFRRSDLEKWAAGLKGCR
ncbi:helix-turn-helix transcriptional regulator [Gemmata sp.]|uniref:helix-turn-helix transcriptional regulator n=1 Tax=Gemmata sp. TaxID=1914242 RepID=UPI003F7269FD